MIGKFIGSSTAHKRVADSPRQVWQLQLDRPCQRPQQSAKGNTDATQSFAPYINTTRESLNSNHKSHSQIQTSFKSRLGPLLLIPVFLKLNTDSTGSQVCMLHCKHNVDLGDRSAIRCPKLRQRSSDSTDSQICMMLCKHKVDLEDMSRSSGPVFLTAYWQPT